MSNERGMSILQEFVSFRRRVIQRGSKVARIFDMKGDDGLYSQKSDFESVCIYISSRMERRV